MKNNQHDNNTPLQTDLNEMNIINLISTHHEKLMQNETKLKISNGLLRIGNHFPKFYSTAIRATNLVGNKYIGFGYQNLIIHILRDIIRGLANPLREKDQIFDNEKVKALLQENLSQLEEKDLDIDFNNLNENQKKVINEIFGAFRKYKTSISNYRQAFKTLYLENNEGYEPDQSDLEMSDLYSDRWNNLYRTLQTKAHFDKSNYEDISDEQLLEFINGFEDMILEISYPSYLRKFNERKRELDEILEETNR